MGGPGSGGHNRKGIMHHVAAGSWRKDRHGPRPAPEPQPQIPACLDDFERAIWRSLMTVAWPDMGPAPSMLDDAKVVAGFCVIYALAYREEDDDRSDGLFTLCSGSAPCRLTQPHSQEFHNLAREAWDALEAAPAAP